MPELSTYGSKGVGCGNAPKLPKNEEMILFGQTSDILQDSALIIESSQRAAYQSVDRILVLRNWLLGKRISKEELNESRSTRYGTKVIPILAEQLTEQYGKGFDSRALYRYDKFYQLYPEIVGTVSPQSSAGTESKIVGTASPQSEQGVAIVYPAVGSNHSGVRLTIPELEKCSGYKDWVDVCKEQ